VENSQSKAHVSETLDFLTLTQIKEWPDFCKWRLAMDCEYEELDSQKVFSIVEGPISKKILGGR
jgi:hypothetical protein